MPAKGVSEVLRNLRLPKNFQIEEAALVEEEEEGEEGEKSIQGGVLHKVKVPMQHGMIVEVGTTTVAAEIKLYRTKN